MGEDAVPIDGEESAVGADAVDAAGEKRRKGDEGLLRLDLAGSHYAAGGDGRRALWCGDDGAGSLSGALLFTNRGDVDGAIGGDGERSDFALGGFVKNEAFRFRCGRILGVLG